MNIWEDHVLSIGQYFEEQQNRDIKSEQIGGNHYSKGGSNMQPWDIIEAWELDYWEGNVLKYLLRHKYKNGLEDLKKARHYLDYLISKTEGDDDE